MSGRNLAVQAALVVVVGLAAGCSRGTASRSPTTTAGGPSAISGSSSGSGTPVGGDASTTAGPTGPTGPTGPGTGTGGSDATQAGAPVAPGSAGATAPPVSYLDCEAVRAAGTAPLRRGDPGYRTGLDRDGDGVACDLEP